MVGLILHEGSTEAMAAGAVFMRWVAPFYFIIAVKIVIDGILRGSGALRYFMVSTFVDLVFRVALSFLLNGAAGYMSIVYAWVIGWGVAAVLAVLFYRLGVWKKRLPPAGETVRLQADC